MSIKPGLRKYRVSGSLAVLAFALTPLNAHAALNDNIMNITNKPTTVTAVQTGGYLIRSDGPDVLPFPDIKRGTTIALPDDGSSKYPLWYRRGN